MTKNAVGYLRLSKYDEATTSPQRQRAAVEKLCADRGWKLAETFEDIDVSGWDGKRRPGLERMLASLHGVDAVVVYRIDRLARSQQEFLRVTGILEAAGVELAATDMTIEASPSGAFVRDVIARVAQLESDNISARSQAMMTYKKERGEWVGRVPFGFCLEGKKLATDPKQMRTLKAAARRYVAGESFSEIARDLGFSIGPLSRMLGSERVQEALGDLGDDLASAIAARKGNRVPTSSQSLLGGIATCAECGSSLVRGSTRGGRERTWAQYRCRKSGHVGISGPWLDEHVSRQVIEAVDTTKLIAAIRARRSSGRTRKASDIEARLAVLEESFVDGTMSEARYRELRGRILERLETARSAERQAGVSLPEDLARDLGKRWGDLSIQAQRQIIGAVLKGIEVAKASGHGAVDPARVTLAWRT